MTASTKLTVLCHSSTPADPSDIEQWMREQLCGIRSLAPPAAIRLSRLTQGLPDSEIENGWLVELELPIESEPRDRDALTNALAETLVDMRLLGLHPQLLSPHEVPRSIAAGDLFRGVASERTAAT